MNVKELREALEEFPDDMEVNYEDDHAGWCPIDTAQVETEPEMSPTTKALYRRIGWHTEPATVVMLR